MTLIVLRPIRWNLPRFLANSTAPKLVMSKRLPGLGTTRFSLASRLEIPARLEGRAIFRASKQPVKSIRESTSTAGRSALTMPDSKGVLEKVAQRSASLDGKSLNFFLWLPTRRNRSREESELPAPFP